MPFAALLVRLAKSEHPAVLRIAAPITRRFSTTSLLAVAALAVTGSLNSVFLLGEIQAVFITPYGRLLLAKLVLFAAMVCIGAWNLLVLKPKFSAEVQPENVANQNLAARFLFRNVLCEIGLGTGVFLIVAILGVSSPPMH